MPDWIYTLPDDGITALAVAVVVGGDLLAALLFRAFAGAWLPLESARTLLDSFRLVVSLTAFVLAFALLQAQTNIRQVHAALAQEANTFDLATREARQLDGPAAAAIANRLLDYGNAVVTEEWPLLAHGRESDRLGAAYRELLHAAVALGRTAFAPQSLYDDLLKNLSLLGQLRDQRISAATVRLPAAFWHAIAAMTLVSILLTAGAPLTLPFRLTTLLPSAALAILIALLIIIDVPFQGQSAIRPVELERVLGLLGPPGR
jgi:hypothetical protein